MSDNTVLWRTNVGSHTWRMNRPDSDIDIFEVYIVPTVDILSGRNSGGGSHFNQTDGTDTQKHEIGKVVDELIKGNINFLIGTMTPLVVYELQINRWDKCSTLNLDEKYSLLQKLREIVIKYGQTKACVNSIRGHAIHNYKKYIIGSDTAREYEIPKKCGLINRVLLFGINILEGNGFKFEPVYKQTPDDVKNMLERFDATVIDSRLPEKTNAEPFRNFLLKIRMDELEDRI